MFARLLFALYERDPRDFERIENHRGRKRVYVAKDTALMHTGERLRDTPYYFESNQSADTFVRVACEILEILGHPVSELRFTADRNER
jgi:negative regulator of replication initiation